MKQIIQNLNTGAIQLVDVSAPQMEEGFILIDTKASLISAGTERMLLEFGRSNLIEKARQRPDKLREVMNKIKTDGLIETIGALKNKLDQPIPLGYSNVGRIVDISIISKSLGFTVGDRVVSNGHHAEVVCVPHNLCAKVPHDVDDDEAAFAVVGTIALQGIRLAQPTIGEKFAVIGLGLIGQIAVQILISNGCRVLGIDINESRCNLAEKSGAEVVAVSKGEDPVEAAMSFSRGAGMDGVIITAATKSSEPVHQAAQMCRKRGRIILVGLTGLELNRADFYQKELSFQVSCSYGPGRYDQEYEQKGHDYPIGFVRWTEKRNFEAVLEMMATRKLNLAPLISHRFSINDATKAYELLISDENALGILLNYDTDTDVRHKRQVVVGQRRRFEIQEPVVSFVGAGNFASRILIPSFKAAGAQLHTLASSGGLSCSIHAKKGGFLLSSTDVDAMLLDDETNTVVIATRHDTHAHLVLEALKAGKHVFVEKPLCLTIKDLNEIQQVYYALVARNLSPLLMVGFNRRFAPHAVKMKELLDNVKVPKSFIVTVNAGSLPMDHWTLDTHIGGGRIIGETCHFVDLLRFLAGAPIEKSDILALDSPTRDTVAIQLKFSDGSIGTIHYFANGSRTFPKERLEVFAGGRILQLNNFRKLIGFGWPNFKRMNLWHQDKGHREEIAAFLKAVRYSEASPIPFEEIVEVTKTTIELAYR